MSNSDNFLKRKSDCKKMLIVESWLPRRRRRQNGSASQQKINAALIEQNKQANITTQTLIASSRRSNKKLIESHRGNHMAQVPKRQQLAMSLLLMLGASLLVLLIGGGGGHFAELVEARVTFEKMTNRDYAGNTHYTIQNVSLFECLGWCKEESNCLAAVFSFVVNPFAALQETTCMLQNETQARQGAHLRATSSGEQLTVVAQPQKATNMYFFNKIELQTESVCSRLWAFERFPNRRLRQRDRQPFHASNKESCQAACMNEQRFVCRSLEYNYISQQCVLSAHDRRSPLVQHLVTQAQLNTGLMNSQNVHDLIEAAGTDYFENACLLGEDICNESRIYDYAKVGLPSQRVAHFVELNYYPDKEMLVKSQAGCVRACTIEHEFICRSILYRSTFKQGQPNCALYHLDQKTFPEGADVFLSHTMQPLLDSGESSATYLEAICNDTFAPSNNGGSLITTSTSSSAFTMPASSASTASLSISSSSSSGSSSSSSNSMGPTTITMPPTSITILPSSTTPNGISVHPNYNHTTTADLERFLNGGGGGVNGQSTSTLSPLMGAPTTIRLPSSFLPSSGSSSSNNQHQHNQIPNNIQISDLPTTNGRLPSHITISPPSQQGGGGGGGHQGQMRQPMGNVNNVHIQQQGNGMMPSHITISPAPPPMRDTLDGASTSGVPTNIQISAGGNTNHDQNCDAHGFCYDVALKCTDTKMIVNVKTQRPFFGRIYALGRSETCNANIKNQNQFQLDMYLSGQECNTQSASGTYTNTIVLQHHNVVLTKADKVYHVRCTYETASRNVSFGMMPVKDMFEVDVNDRNQETISITASSDAPLPKISILTLDNKEASTVRIGDRLTFRIEIPDNTPYGIFARSCIAMAKDARSTFEIIDEHGCPVDHTIFPNFTPTGQGNALESNYEAFRFTESYGVIFQCNVKYCIGKCEPVNCGIGREQVESWGRRKRSIGGSAEEKRQIGKQLGDDMTLSREILVLDLKEKTASGSGGGGSGGGGVNGATNGDLSSDEGSLSLVSDAMAHKAPLKLQQAANRQEAETSGGADQTSPSTSSQNNQANLHCLTSQSLLLLTCSIGLFFVLYVCLVAYFFARRDTKISVIKHQFH